ncbi:MAG TPA: sialate O-acetylesterase [Pirellulaceae bacterium]|nr:sialate O-acetylesterase [Pirellulaceae bacterium]
MQRLLFAGVALCLLATTCLPAAEPVKLPPKKSLHLYLLVGQSNMAGRGKVEAPDKQPHPRVLMLNKQDEWVPAIDPLHFDKPAAGVGLGRSFASALAAANPEITIGLVPCAVGGSPIDAWKPGVYYAPTKSHPWDDALRRAKLAQESGEFHGILWHQGESDCTDKLAPDYSAKLQALVKAFRHELGAELPFVIGQLGKFDGQPWNAARTAVDQAQRDLTKQLPHVAFVESTGLKPMADKVHFDAASCREFGQRYATVYLQLVKEAKPVGK